jgi:di/tricarboxylate transporter
MHPYSHQSNLMVMQPGGYTGAQFARFGAWILVACLVTVCGSHISPVEFVERRAAVRG